jgi:hypothetical protein
MAARILLGLVMVAAVTLSGCGGTESPPPPPSTSPTTTTSGTPVPSAPPSVSDPVDLTPYARHPCTALTVQQVTDLGFPYEKIEELTDSESGGERWQCWWAWDNRPPELPSRAGLYTFTVYLSGDPLAKAYQDHNLPRNGSEERRKFEEHTVRGLPAVARFWGEGDYQCEVIVGVGNGQGFAIWSGATAISDDGMCQRLLAAAELIVDTARG